MKLTPAEIRARLVLKGITVQDIATALGDKRTMVSNVIHGQRRTPGIRRAIAGAIGATYREVWGEEDPGIDRLRGPKSVASVTQSDPDATQAVA